MKILIVDDHPLTCAGLASLLASSYRQATVDTAHTARVAREMLLGQAEIDWLFLDIHLRDDPEWRLLEWLRETCWIGKTILISAEADNDLLRPALAAGARGFIPKTADPAMVLDGFDTIRFGRIFLPPNLERLHQVHDNEAARKPLSPRQQDVLAYLLQGSANKIIARELGITLHTVKEYVSAIFKIYGVTNRLELVLKLGSKRHRESPDTEQP